MLRVFRDAMLCNYDYYMQSDNCWDLWDAKQNWDLGEMPIRLDFRFSCLQGFMLC